MSAFLIQLPLSLKIAAVIPNPRGVELHFEDERVAPIEMSGDWVLDHEPAAGGYLVQLDGRLTYSTVDPELFHITT